MDARLLKSLMEKKPNEGTNNRLESLRLPRDLSLGGTKPKKIIQPNLNAQRSKHRSKESIKKLDSIKKEKPKLESKKKFSDSKRFVQSQGVFSEGSVLEKKASGFSDRSRYKNEGSTSMTKPAFKKSETVNDDDEENTVTRLIDMGIKHVDDNVPRWNYRRHHNNSNKVKTEKVDPYFCKVEEAEVNTRLALIKLPQSLAGKGFSNDSNATKLLDYNLNMMTEGKIGSLQITRSGKMYMKIGNLRYLMKAIDCTGGPETIASYMDSTKEENKAKFAMLGDVEGRFELMPQWKEL